MKKETNYPSIDKTHLEGVKFGEKHPIIPNFLSITNALNLLALKNDEYVVDCLDLRVKGKEFKKDYLILAKTLIQLGIKPGDTIACATPNYYQGLLVFMAANTIGALTSYLNPYSSKDTIKEYLNMVDAKVLVNTTPGKEINEYYRKNSGVEYTISLDEKNINSRDFYSEKTAEVGNTNIINFHEIGHIAEFQKSRFRTWFGGSQEALILQTSGSTGKPKSMLFTNENVIAALMYLGNSTHTPGPTPGDRRWMNVVPFMYPYGFVASTLGPLFVNRELILTPNVNASQISEYYKKNPNLIFGSPAFLDLTMKYLPEDQDTSSLKIYVSGGDFLSKQKSLDAIDFFAEHGAKVEMANGSGNGEILGCCTNSMNVEYRPETVGQLVVGPKYLVVNPDTMEEVKYGEEGVLLVSGKHMFKHYIHNEEETNKVKVNINGTTYYNTGNIGILHKDRYFTLTGRASRFYIISTLNKVYCELVQKIISFNKMVDTCVVVPKPNDEMLFEGKAYIKLKPGYERDEESVKKILEACYFSYIDPNTQEELKLKEYEIPASVTFVDEIKRHDDSEKIDYEFYRKEAEKEYQLEKASTKEDVIQKKLS